MKLHSRWAITVLFVVASSVSSVTNAALVDRGGGLIYDSDLNITWQANATLFLTNTFGIPLTLSSGYSLDAAQNWIAAMNASNYLGYNDWRLPATLQPDSACGSQSTYNGNSYTFGYNCTGSEMGHLFYNELGGVGTQNISITHNSNYNLFQNLTVNINGGGPINAQYWSGTPFAADITGQHGWAFSFSDGSQNAPFAFGAFNVWAVRSGDVAAVPMPAAVWLFGSGLFGLIGVARRKAA